MNTSNPNHTAPMPLLTANTDMSKTDATRHVIESMVDALNRHEIDSVGAYFAETFRWMGNTGCGVKNGLKAFQDHWQRPFQAAFSNKVAIEQGRLFMGEWAAGFGYQRAIHSGRFMGIDATGIEVRIPYMDFWKVVDGKIVDNWVMVDFPAVLAQLGVDVFNGEGWEAYDKGERLPPYVSGK